MLRKALTMIGAIAATLAIGLVAGSTPAAAQEIGFTCGRVTAFTPSTATADGSITIGTRTFVIRAGAMPNPPPPVAVGTDYCVGEVDAAGSLNPFRANPFSDTVCGAVVGSGPGTLTVRTNREWTFPVRAGVTFTATQLSGSQCFRTAVNAQGNAEVIAYVGTEPTGGAPGGTTAPPPRQLPSTSTSTSTSVPAAPNLLFIGSLMALTSLLAFRGRRAAG